MKAKSHSNTTNPALAPPAQKNPGDEIPTFLKPFEGKTAAQICAENGLSPEQHAAMAGVLFGFLGEWGATIPKSAKLASKLFWRNYFGAELKVDDSIEDFGVAIRILEASSEKPHSFLSPEIGKLILTLKRPLVDFFEKDTRSQSPEKTAMFYNGRARAEKILEKMNNPDYLKMVKRAKIYYVIADAWRVFEKFSSQAEAERWLRSNSIIGENVDSSEVRAVLRLVGLHYRGPGRPKKSETGRSVSGEIRI